MNKKEAEAGLPEQWESNYESEWQKALRNKLSEVDL